VREVATMNQYAIGRAQAATRLARELVATRRGRVGGRRREHRERGNAAGRTSRTASSREVERFAPLGRQDPARRAKTTEIGR